LFNADSGSAESEKSDDSSASLVFLFAMEWVSDAIVLGRPEEVNAFIQNIRQFRTKLLIIVLVSCGALWNSVENTSGYNLPSEDKSCKGGRDFRRLMLQIVGR
jgi:hypothetical protein